MHRSISMRLSRGSKARAVGEAAFHPTVGGPRLEDKASGAQERLAKAKRTKRTIKVLQVLTALVLFFGVWFVGFARDDVAPVLPDTSTVFSLDLKIAATSDHGLVYAVEQRARPFYRIFSLDTSTGETTTIFTVPEDAIIYGIALSPDRDTLAVSYSPDFVLEGSGLWTLDIDSGDFEEVFEVQANRFFIEPTWTSSGETVLVTEVDRSLATEHLSIVELGVDGDSYRLIADDAVGAAVQDDDLFFLHVDDDNARRSIAYLPDGDIDNMSLLDIESDSFDLDHLVAGPEDVFVAVLESTDESGLTVGTTADAHGSHDVPSMWWELPVDGASPSPTGMESIIVYDAALLENGAIVYATLEGLSIGDGERLDLVKSRALRFVAG